MPNDCRCRINEGLRSTHCPIHGTCNCCHGCLCPTHDEPEEFVQFTFEQLMALAWGVQMTPEDLERQRRSFAFGNANIDNPAITRELIDEAADKIDSERAGSK